MLSLTNTKALLAKSGVLAALAMSVGLTQGQPTALVDTGAGATSTIGSASLFAQDASGHFQYLGARITLTQSATLDHVDLWLSPGFGGQVAVMIRPVNPAKNGLPGSTSPPYPGATAIYQQTYAVPGGSSTDWFTFANFNPVLAAGTYWVTFEPVAGTGFNRTPPKGVAGPLERYAFYGDGNPGYLDLGLSQAFGVRVWGTPYPGLTFGTATRSIMTGNPTGPFDTISGAEGKVLDYHWIIDLAGYGGTFAVGRLTAGLEDNSIQNLNGLSAGANATTCWSLYWGPCASAGARGIAYRTFKNTGSVAKTIKVKTLFEGAFYRGGRAAAFVYVLNPTGFTARIAASGLPAPQYLLQRDGLGELSNGDSTLSLAPLFQGYVNATASAFPPFLDGVFQTIPLETGLFTVNPGDYFVLLFDVSVYSANGWTAGFGDTLKPAADFITDTAGALVPEIVAVGPPAPVSKPAATIVLALAVPSLPIGQTNTVTATVRDASGAPIANKTVYFHVVSGPSTGEPGAAVTDASGQATFVYSSPAAGADQITATVKSVTSNTVTVNWTSPGLLDHIAIAPASATIVVGGTQAYTAAGYDKFNNLIGDVTSTTTFSISPDGTCAAASCTATAAGPHTVTGTSEGKTAQAALNVTGGVVDAAGPVTANVVTAQSPLAVNVGTTMTATVSDATTGGSNVAAAFYSVDGGPSVSMQLSPAGAVSTQASAALAGFAQPGVYNICVRGRDVPGNIGAAACVLVPVYDPTGGFVTGGGEVDSPAGADLANPAAAGPATFGFVSKYLPGRSTPDGNLQFQFKQGGIEFKSTSMDWLVVNGQPRATFRGTGRLNGTNECKFEVDAWDGSLGGADGFGLKIFACGSGGDRYYLPARPLTKGSIVIH